MFKNKWYAAAVVGVCALAITLAFMLTTEKNVNAPTSGDLEQVRDSTNSAENISFVGKEEVLQNALNLYISKKQSGIDMTNGPCLGKVAEDWVLDIAHNPRTADDDKKENQCQDYLDGRVKHFIELDESGNLIQAK